MHKQLMEPDITLTSYIPFIRLSHIQTSVSSGLLNLASLPPNDFGFMLVSLRKYNNIHPSFSLKAGA